MSRECNLGWIPTMLMLKIYLSSEILCGLILTFFSVYIIYHVNTLLQQMTVCGGKQVYLFVTFCCGYIVD